MPASALGLVLFAHGSGSNRHSPRNQFVARSLELRGFATLLFDLLTREEDRPDTTGARLRVDISLVASRLLGVTDWALRAPGVAGLPIGYVGASTGAAACFMAAAQRPDVVRAIVARGGRPDLATPQLPSVRAATLLVVGGADRVVLDLNRMAAMELTAPCRLVIIPEAGHLFREPHALDEVARLAGDWFEEHLPARAFAKEASA